MTTTRSPTYGKFVPDSGGCRHDGAGGVMLHHIGELSQVSLYKFYGLRRLWGRKQRFKVNYKNGIRS